ncbi:MAG: hypothetical protein KDA78_14685 [Planctomycetaceae bacterium]|nr:hypothetical protein [Planctomycetaceae bacterium]
MSLRKMRVIGFVSVVLLIITPVAQAGHGHCHHGHGEVAALAFAVGAVATLLAPPPPPRVIHHHHPMIPAPPPYGYPYPPVIQREYHYVNPPVYTPAPVRQYQPMPQPVVPAMPSTQVPATARVGTVVDRLPPNAYSENRNGVTYFTADGIYYLQVQFGVETKYVIVQPQ